MEDRKLCPSCNQRPVAVNYIREGVTHYRKVCDVCSRQGKKVPVVRPGWVRSGYKKKPQCERCGFKAKFPKQLGVFYTDGNLKNNDWTNLKTVCLNCQCEIYELKLPWKSDPLTPDF